MVRIHDRPFTILAAILLIPFLQAASASAAPLTVGAYYYPWYGTGGLQWDRGYARSELVPPEEPLLGRYDSRDPAVVAQHYAWAHAYGVGVFFTSWAGPGSYDDGTILGSLLPSPARGPTRISILYESLQALGIGRDDLVHLTAAKVAKMVGHFDYLARTTFGDPGYYRIAGRPVVVLYASRIYRGLVAEAIHGIRRSIESLYGVDPYLIGDEVDWDNPPDPARIKLFDAITGYTLYSRTQPAGWASTTGFLQAVGRRVRQFQTVARREGVGFVPGSLPGFDDRGVRPEADHHVLSRQVGPAAAPGSLFSSSLALAGTLVDPTLRLVTVTSWNEWNEDTQIEPTSPAPDDTGTLAVTQGYPFDSYGFGLLDELAAFETAWEESPRPPVLGSSWPD